MPLYNEQDYVGLRIIGLYASQCLDRLLEFIKPGKTTRDIDDFVKQFAMDHNLLCATLGYRGFPAHCCTSVNNVVAHGIPSATKILKEGDIVKVDVTFIQSGYYGDSCRTYAVGKISRKAEIVSYLAREALRHGIEQCKPGNHIGHIGFAIESYINQSNASVVREYIGHGIGKTFHDDPEVPHWCSKYNIKNTPEMVPGLVFTIEPIINLGAAGVKTKSDGWSVVTRDRSLSAQWEVTLGITEYGHEIFTPMDFRHHYSLPVKDILCQEKNKNSSVGLNNLSNI